MENFKQWRPNIKNLETEQHNGIYVNNNLKCTNANTEDGNIMILNDNSAVNNSNRMRLGRFNKCRSRNT